MGNAPCDIGLSPKLDDCKGMFGKFPKDNPSGQHAVILLTCHGVVAAPVLIR